MPGICSKTTSQRLLTLFSVPYFIIIRFHFYSSSQLMLLQGTHFLLSFSLTVTAYETVCQRKESQNFAVAIFPVSDYFFCPDPHLMKPESSPDSCPFLSYSLPFSFISSHFLFYSTLSRGSRWEFRLFLISCHTSSRFASPVHCVHIAATATGH